MSNSGSRSSSTRGSPYGSHADLMDEEHYVIDKKRRHKRSFIGGVDLDDAESILRKYQNETTEYTHDLVSEIHRLLLPSLGYNQHRELKLLFYKKLVKYRGVLEPSRDPRWSFFANIRLLAFSYFCKKSPSQMFDWVPNGPLKLLIPGLALAILLNMDTIRVVLLFLIIF